jgi:thiamine-monophosphate kinase
VTTVGEIGEFPLIERIAAAVDGARLPAPSTGGFRLNLGIGDDAAAWTPARGTEVLTTDTVVEGVHFTRETVPWLDLGWRLWAANVSDVIAMGGVPLVGVVTLGLPGSLEVQAIDDLYAGMIEACGEYGTLIVGGDIVTSRDVFVTLALNGVCEGRVLRRDVARPGDVIGVSGPLGGSAGGLRVMSDHLAPNDALVAIHRRPKPRVSTGLALAEAGVTGAMDVSDGLIADLGKLCKASGVAATVRATDVPVEPSLYESFGAQEALLLALGGGEDYEVLFTGPREAVERAVEAIDGAGVIGEVTSGKAGDVRVIDKDGRKMALVATGWEHLGR